MALFLEVTDFVEGGFHCGVVTGFDAFFDFVKSSDEILHLLFVLFEISGFCGSGLILGVFGLEGDRCFEALFDFRERFEVVGFFGRVGRVLFQGFVGLVHGRHFLAERSFVGDGCGRERERGCRGEQEGFRDFHRVAMN